MSGERKARDGKEPVVRRRTLSVIVGDHAEIAVVELRGGGKRTIEYRFACDECGHREDFAVREVAELEMLDHRC